MLWKSWREIPVKTKNLVHNCLSTNYNFEDISESMDSYLDMLFYERYKQWKNDLHKHYELFYDLEVTLEKGCLLELKNLPNEWARLCSHSQDPAMNTCLH